MNLPHIYDENVHTEKMQERMTQTVKQNILINKTVFSPKLFFNRCKYRWHILFTNTLGKCYTNTT